MTSKKRKVLEVKAGPDIISGFGENVVQVMDGDTGDKICFIGIVNGEEMVWFPKPATYERIESVYSLMHKKKFKKALSKGKTRQAQAYADRKLKG